jgi:tetratricopeptide (TPR) repeat protein
MGAVSISRFAGVALSLLLLWRIVFVNAVLYGDDGRPRIPAIPASSNASAPERAEGGEALRGALRENPAEVAALLMLARDDEQESNYERASRAYLAAYRLAPLDREVLGEAARFFLGRGDVPNAVALLDKLAEHFPESRDRAFPVLLEVLTSRQHEDAWNGIVARSPEWLGAFIVASCKPTVDPLVLVPLLLSRIAAGKAAPAEVGCVVDNLRIAERWAEAYQVWLNTLPRERLAEVGFIFNGGFEFAPSGIGFDWVPAKQPEREVGHSVEMARTSGVAGKRSLRVAYNGKRQGGNAIAQFLALEPGRYELSGLARPEGMKIGRGVQWTVRCVAGGKPQEALATSERFLGSSEWRRFAFDITVPTGCRGQILQLEPAGAPESVAFLGGTVWFDDLMLRRGG